MSVADQLLVLRQMDDGPTDKAIRNAEYYAGHHMGAVTLHARRGRGITIACDGMDDLICHASGNVTPLDLETLIDDVRSQNERMEGLNDRLCRLGESDD